MTTNSCDQNIKENICWLAEQFYNLKYLRCFLAQPLVKIASIIPLTGRVNSILVEQSGIRIVSLRLMLRNEAYNH